MGSLCGTEAQPLLSEEETALVAASTALGFHSYTARYLEAQIKRVSRKGRVTPEQLQRFATTAGLNDFSNNACFNTLLEDGSYDVEVLAVLVVLLGSGTHEEKAMLLFEMSDNTASSIVSPERFRQLLEAIAHLSVECLPLLLHMNQGLKSYCEQAAKGAELAIDRIVTNLCGGRPLIQEEFVQGLLRHHEWLSPTEVREALRRVSVLKKSSSM